MQALEAALFLVLAGDTALVALLPGDQHLVTVTAGGGTFTLTYAGQTTATINYDATAATVATRLAALSTIGTGNVAVSGSAGGPYTVALVGALMTSQTVMTGSGAALTGQGATLTVAQRTAVYNTVAPDNAPSPYLTFAKVSSTLERTFTARMSEEYRYQVTVFCQGASRATVNSALARVEAVLDRQVLSVSGETFWLCEKEGDNPAQAEDVGGELWQWGGADYRIVLGG